MPALKKVLIILGPTAVGKSDYAVERALEYGSPVISCDSRQIFREMTIGTAVPDASQLEAVEHFFVHSNSVLEDYTAGRYEVEAHALVKRLFEDGGDRTLVMCGGSGFYVDAFVNGLDEFPPADQSLRMELTSQWKEEGVEVLARRLRELDPESCAQIDLSNGQRVVRALEVCIMTGRKFSSFKTSPNKKRDFEIEKIGLTRPREELYRRIDSRVLKMVDDGLVEEVRSLIPFRDRPALQTVGYKEIFAWFDFLDGKVSTEGWGPTSPGDGPVTTLDRAVELIQRNTRHYARKQMSYWRRDPSIRWIEI